MENKDLILRYKFTCENGYDYYTDDNGWGYRCKNGHAALPILTAPKLKWFQKIKLYFKTRNKNLGDETKNTI